MSISLHIPGDHEYEIKHVVFDMNGTLANGGMISKETVSLVKTLSKQASIHVITADTHGTAHLIEKMLAMTAKVKVVDGSHTSDDKKQLVEELGEANTIAVGNGANDMAMFEKAAISIGIVGSEGIFAPLLTRADIVVASIEDALLLLLEPKRIIATLRR